MATIKLSLSTKKCESAEKKQIMMRFSYSREKVFRVKTRLFVLEKFWSEKKECIITSRMHTKEQVALVALQSQLDGLKNHLIEQVVLVNATRVTKEWVQHKIDDYLSYGKQEDKGVEEKSSHEPFFEMLETFINVRCTNQNRKSQFHTLVKLLHRYEKIRGGGFAWSLDEVTDVDFARFEEFLQMEHTFFNDKGECIKYKKVYSTEEKFRVPKARGLNGVHYNMKRLRTFWNWCVRTGRTKQNILAKHVTKAPIYGTPFYLTKEERDHLYNFDFSSSPALAKQRDIFVFQSCIGIRPGDMYKLTLANIISTETGDFIEYVPNKTVNETANVVRVPLVAIARTIIDRYASDNANDPLLPFISMQKYNSAIHKMLKEAGINRMVTVLNPTTRKEEQHPLYEVATAYMGRRNFIGILYSKVQDPNLIGSMTGHTEGSKAFVRYRAIDDQIKQTVISNLE